MQILKAKNDAGGIKDGTRLREHVRVDVHHQIAAGCVLHYETNVRLIALVSHSRSTIPLNSGQNMEGKKKKKMRRRRIVGH